MAFAPRPERRKGREARDFLAEAKTGVVSPRFIGGQPAGVADDGEDVLAIGDNDGTISFWSVSRDPSARIRLIGMPKHSAMPLLFNGAQLEGCQMSAMSRRLLEQHGAEVGQVTLVEETPEAAREAKHIAPPRSASTASTTSTSSSASNPRTASPATSAPSAAFFPASPTSPVGVKADAKAQNLLIEVTDLIDEVYPENDQAVATEQANLLRQLKPFQERRAELTLKDCSALRKLRDTLEEVQEARASPAP